MSEDTRCKFAQQFSVHFHNSHMLPFPYDLAFGNHRSDQQLSSSNITRILVNRNKVFKNKGQSKLYIGFIYVCVCIILKNPNIQYFQSLCSASTAFLSSSAVPAKEETRLGHVSEEHDSFLLGAIRSKTIKCKSCFRFLLRLLLFHSGMGSASSQLKSVVLN